MQLKEAIKEIQRSAAAWPTDELRTEIAVRLDVLTEVIGDLADSPNPGSASLDDKGCPSCAVRVAALVTALYVRELTLRPRPAPVFAWADFSRN